VTDAVAETMSAGAATTRRHRSSTRTVVEWVVIVVVALLAATVVKASVVEAYAIPSASMSPTIQVGDRVLVDKLSYDFGAPRRGDIIVFAKPAADIDPGVTDLIKRVIGLPGQTIQSGPGGTILVDGKPIAEPWLSAAARANPGPPIPQMTVPEGDYYVMGDNRDDSDDSRYFGPVPGRLIIGRAVVRIWPLSRLHRF
jgi:signal peptidase I